MKYLFTYKDGPRALAQTNNKKGITFNFNDTKVSALLVDPTASNATNIRVKLRTQTKALGYVPSLILPYILKAKYGEQLINPQGIDVYGRRYDKVVYNQNDGRFYAISYTYSDLFGPKGVLQSLSYAATSLDGVNWQENNLTVYTFVDEYNRTRDAWSKGNALLINTVHGVYMVAVYIDLDDLASYSSSGVWHVILNIYKTSEGSYSLIYQKVKRCYFASPNITPSIELHAANSYKRENAIIACSIDNTSPGDFASFWVNLNNDVVTELAIPSSVRAINLSYNSKLNGSGTYSVMFDTYNGTITKGSYDGVNFSEDIPTSFNVAFGELNGYEILRIPINSETYSYGLSEDGITIAIPFTKHPIGYDPIDQNYISAFYRGYEDAGGDHFYLDIYYSKNGTDWTLKETTKIRLSAVTRQYLTGSPAEMGNVTGF